MTTYDWYKIFNLTEFEATQLYSKTYTLDLEDKGIKNFLVTKSNCVSLTYSGVMLSLELNDKNPFEFEDFAIYLKESTQDVYLGLPVES